MSTQETKARLRDRFLKPFQRARTPDQGLVSSSAEQNPMTAALPVDRPAQEHTTPTPHTSHVVATPAVHNSSGSSWSSIRDAFVKAKDESIAELPSLSGLLADFLGFASEFKEVEDAKKDLSNTAKQLDEFIGVLKRFGTRSDLTDDSRARLQETESYITSQHKLMSGRIRKMTRGPFVVRASVAREVAKDIVNIISHVHGNVLLLHIKIVDTSRDDELIEKKLRPVSMAAVFTTTDRGCMAGTRTAILAQLLKWSKDSTDPPVFWLSGMAGVGKTAIAQSFCDLLHENQIFVASFFCSRRTSVDDHRNAMRIIPTLSALMAQKYPKFRAALLTKLSSLGPGRDPLSLTLDQQFELLLQAPLSDSKPLSNTVLVIDALDELEDPHLMGNLLDSILAAAESLSVKVFLTSRPEDQVRFRFPNQPSKRHSVLRLHDVDQYTVKEDIKLYLVENLKTIRRFHSNEPDTDASAENPWPAPSQLDRLVELANNLFLYAATVVRYLKDEDPEARLKILLNAVGILP